MAFKKHHLLIIFLCYVIPKSTQRECNELVDTMNLPSLKLFKPYTFKNLYIDDKCLEVLQKQRNLELLEIENYKLTDNQLYQILQNKPSLKYVVLNNNALRRFNFSWFDPTIALSELEIHYNDKIRIVGSTKITENIEVFRGNHNGFTTFPLGKGWSNLQEVDVRDNLQLDWSTFHVEDFPKLERINGKSKEVFLTSINYHEQMRNRQIEDASMTVINSTTTTSVCPTGQNETRVEENSNIDTNTNEPMSSDTSNSLLVSLICALVIVIILMALVIVYLICVRKQNSFANKPGLHEEAVGLRAIQY